MGRKIRRPAASISDISQGAFLDREPTGRQPRDASRRQRGSYNHFGSLSTRRAYLSTGIGRLLSGRTVSELAARLDLPETAFIPRTGVPIVPGAIMAKLVSYGISRRGKQQASPEAATRSALQTAEANAAQRCATTARDLEVPVIGLGVRKWGTQMLLFATLGDTPGETGDDQRPTLLTEKIHYAEAFGLPPDSTPKLRDWRTAQHTVALAGITHGQANHLEPIANSYGAAEINAHLLPVGVIKTELPG